MFASCAPLTRVSVHSGRRPAVSKRLLSSTTGSVEDALCAGDGFAMVGRAQAKRPRELRAKTRFHVLRVLMTFLRVGTIDNEPTNYGEINVSSTRMFRFGSDRERRAISIIKYKK